MGVSVRASGYRGRCAAALAADAAWVRVGQVVACFCDWVPCQSSKLKSVVRQCVIADWKNLEWHFICVFFYSLGLCCRHDSCCFATAGLHANVTQYNRFVQGELRAASSPGWFQTSANLGNYHEVNYRDKVVIGTMIERLRRPGGITRAHYDDIPFNIFESFDGEWTR